MRKETSPLSSMETQWPRRLPYATIPNWQKQFETILLQRLHCATHRLLQQLYAGIPYPKLSYAKVASSSMSLDSMLTIAARIAACPPRSVRRATPCCLCLGHLLQAALLTKSSLRLGQSVLAQANPKSTCLPSRLGFLQSTSNKSKKWKPQEGRLCRRLLQLQSAVLVHHHLLRLHHHLLQECSCLLLALNLLHHLRLLHQHLRYLLADSVQHAALLVWPGYWLVSKRGSSSTSPLDRRRRDLLSRHHHRHQWHHRMRTALLAHPLETCSTA